LLEYRTGGGQSAFAAIARRHIDLVHNTALRLTRDPDVARTSRRRSSSSSPQGQLDPTHDGAGRLALQRTRFAAANARKVEARRRYHERKGGVMSYDQRTSADDAARFDEIAPLLDGSPGQLANRDRDALLLKYIQGKSHRDVGQTMGISEEAARKRVGRALEKLRGFFASRGVAMTTAAPHRP